MPEQTNVSAASAVMPAFNAMKKILFEPFAFNKWLVLGFCAFLANLGRGGGGGFNYSNPFGGGTGKAGPVADQVFNWIDAHMMLIGMLVVGVLLVAIAFGALLQWLSSRGEFMFLDGVAKSRGAIVEPWNRYGDQGNNLFLVRFVLGLVGLGSLVVIGVFCWLIARPDIAARRFGGSAIVAILAGGFLFLIVAVVMLAINLLLRDFVVPIMYKKGVNTLVAFGMLRTTLLRQHVGAFVIFYILKLAMSMVAGMAIIMVTLVTACLCLLGCIPVVGWYVSSVVFLPVFVFFRCYSLYFLEQFGDAWRIMPETEVAPPPGPPPQEPADQPALAT